MDAHALVASTADDDLPFEEDVLRNAGSLRSWWRYLQFKSDAPPKVRYLLFERALKELPGSYKLWFNYLQERKQHVMVLRIDNIAYQQLNNIFERCLAYMHKMPRIWEEYLKFLMAQKKITYTRRTFDRALKALPITQHYRIWTLYIKFIKQCGVPETAIRVFRRFLKLEPEHVEQYIDFLIQAGHYDEAAQQLARVVNDDKFISSEGKSRHELWMRLCDLCIEHADKITSLKVEAIIRSALRKYTNEVGKLWVALAQYYINLGNFEKARDIFEEGMNTVMTVRDFSQIWDAYTKYEYDIISTQLQEMKKRENNMSDDSIEDEALELRMARYEDLIERQPLLISNVRLRQNPHNVNEWHSRIKLFNDNPKKKVEEYTRALTTVDPLKATGKAHTLWLSFAQFWEENDELDNARKVFEKAVQVNFKKLEHLAHVWCCYVEMELRHHNFQRARELIQRATTIPPNPRAIPKDAPTTKRIFKSVRLWSLYADLEESLGTFLSTKAVYEKIIDLRIATPQIILNYAQFLEEHNYFEESFKAYEKGVAAFRFPHALEIWVVYLQKFQRRYGGEKLERLRDLFEQAIEDAPAKEATMLYLMYAQTEEKYGLARRAMQIYDRAVRHVHEDDKPFMFNVYIARATEFFGVTRTREIFEKAIQILPEKYVKEYCLRYANLERKLGEIDRARAIYIHCAQFCDPRVDTKFWDIWKEFEIQHGNVETFKEMLRIKRSVVAQFNISINAKLSAEVMAKLKEQEQKKQQDQMKQLEQGLANTTLTTPPAATLSTDDTMAKLNALQQRFVAGKQKLLPEGTEASTAATATTTAATTTTATTTGANAEEIRLDEDMGTATAKEPQISESSESEEEAATIEIEQKQVPETVFGGLASMVEDTKTSAASALEKDVTTNVTRTTNSGASGDTKQPLGAKERLRRKRGI
jgi:pre-mRNA-splicing factor SYF1